MPVLNWIGKDAVARHDAEVPFRLLHDVPELTCGDADSGNLIAGFVSEALLEADNVLPGETLKAAEKILLEAIEKIPQT